MAKRIVIAGASGFIGRALSQAALKAGYEVVRLVRRDSSKNSGTTAEPAVATWDPAIGEIDSRVLAGAAGVVVLNGVPILGHRWTPKYRALLRSSRINSVRTIVDAMADLPEAERPATLISGSAVGYYGADRGDELLVESSAPGTDFLAQLCLDWEAEAMKAPAGTRVVRIRTGLVIGRGGGMMKILAPLYRLGLGGRLGTGKFWMPSISLTDHVRAILFALENPISGSINAVGPVPRTNREWNHRLGRYFNRPALFFVPRFVLDIVLGREAANQTALASQRALPQALLDAGFEFTAPTLGEIFAQEFPR